MMERKYGVIIGYISMFVQNVTILILTPLMIYMWGVEDYGVYRLVITITAYFMLLDMGAGYAIIKYFSEYRGANYKNKTQNLIAIIIFFYTAISLVIITIALVAPNIFHAIFPTFSDKEIELAKLLFFVSMINVVINLFYNCIGSLLKSYEKHILLNGINLLKNIIRFTSIFYLVKIGGTAYTIVIADLIINLVFCVIAAFYIVFILKIVPKIRGITLGFIGSIFSFSGFVFIEMVAYQLVWSVDYIILGIFTSSTIIAIYSIGTMITSFFESLAIVIYNVVMPRIMQIVSDKEPNEVLTSELIKIGRINLYVLCLPVVGFVFLGKPFFSLWAGSEFISAYYVAIIVLIPQFFFRVQYVVSIVLWAKERQKVKALISIAVATINLLITIILVQRLEMIGAAIGTAFAFLFGYTIGEGLYIHKKLGLNLITLYKGIYKGTSLGMILICSISWIITRFGDTTWLSLILQTAIISILYIVIMWFVAFTKKEKRMLLSLIGK
ncbi:lipopolysaccharide biosynthesis protein [Paenibacillus flagellatus]|uniref:Uncharacterized protein n=1 Tax=Paenibacillus flagellatus TaxID=2211139 RepID=A0A2V5K1G6_9BACL|nr:oligosaccharide flippase family protein [Paenibacillus flagellatus]PYI52941.1 hypothetical protein DLM86_18210 [Paenibacillus flagellatus]